MDLQITRWIREQDENGAVSLARTLCMAEAGRYRLALDAVSFSGRVKAGDQGIDGRTHFPIDLGQTLFPKGAHVWQVKSGRATPSAATELDSGRHAGLLEAIKGGADYVLFWANDPTDVVRSNVRESFTQAVRKVRGDANVTVLFTDEIERLCYQHVAVLAQNGPVPISGLVGLEIWAPREFELIEFQADKSREVTLDLLRKHAGSGDEPNELHIFGDSGVGKSRLVYQALSQDGIRERVLVAPDPASWDRGLLSTIASTPGSSLVLVVDDCEADDRAALTRLVGMSRGRVRLITVGSRANRERPIDDRRRREVLPLETAASQKIAKSIGLDDQQATLVANLTEGYPGLAAILARALAYGDPKATMLARIRADDDIGSVLARLVDEAEIPLLGMLALFERIGFDDDVAPELTLACEAFSVDEVQVREVAEQELQRFVSTAGRFRRVTPRLFAIWLASRFLATRPGVIVDEMSQLPETLRERIVDQMREFAGDPVVSRTIGALLERDPFTSGAIARVDDGAARLLHVAAIVNPEAAIAAIERIMDGVTTEDLIETPSSRRGLVEALTLLLWFEEYFDRAATAALCLALAENEDWSNNATGTLQGIYRIFLGGTGATYAQRITWTRKALDVFGMAAISVIIPGLALAFDSHESRTSPNFGGRTAPKEWSPSSFEDEVAARRSAWNLLIEVALAEPSSRPEVAKSLARGIRTAIARGISTDVLDSLVGVDWTPRGRAELIEALTHARVYDHPERDVDARIESVITHLAGEAFADRAQYVFAASVWELSEDRDEMLTGLPSALTGLVDQAMEDIDRARLQLVELSQDGNPDTVSRVFEELAKRAPDPDFERELERLSPTPAAALIGYVRGLTIAEVLNPVTLLEGWVRNQNLSGFVVQCVHLLPASDQLAQLAVLAVRNESSAAADLGRFLYGGWTKDLGADVLGDILSLLAQAVRGQLESGDGSRAGRILDEALGIADQWTSDNVVPPPGTTLRSAIDDLLVLAEGNDVQAPHNSMMLDFHVSHIVPRLGLSTHDRLSLLLRRLRSLRSFPSEYDLGELDALVIADPHEVANAMLDLLLASQDGEFHRWEMWLEDARILTRIQRGADSQELAELVLGRSKPEEWRALIAHVAFDTDLPDPVVVALLSSSHDEELRAAATSRFIYPRITMTGPESMHLRQRREAVRQWRTAQGEPSLFTDWLDNLVVVLDDLSRRAEAREAEERW
jgi:hypothetical protein